MALNRRLLIAFFAAILILTGEIVSSVYARDIVVEEINVVSAGYCKDPVSENPLNDISTIGAEDYADQIGRILLRNRAAFNGYIDADTFAGDCKVEITEDRRDPLYSTFTHEAIKILLLCIDVGPNNAQWLVDNYDIYINGKRYRLLLTDPYNPEYPEDSVQSSVYAVIDELRIGKNYLFLIPKRGIPERARFLGLGNGRSYLRFNWEVEK